MSIIRIIRTKTPTQLPTYLHMASHVCHCCYDIIFC